MEKNNEEYAIEVQDVYKTFNVYLDKANSMKEKMLFWKRNRKEVRQVLKGINLNIKNYIIKITIYLCLLWHT